MGKVYLLPEGVAAAGGRLGGARPDVDDPTLDLATWRRRIGRHSGELKNLLKNQAFVAGIGNGYSDEVLWAARLAPFRKRSTLAAEEVDRLYDAAREVPHGPSGSCGGGCRHASRWRYATSCRCIARAASPARGAAR